MKLFKNEKLEKVNEQLSKLETKKAGIENKISEMETVLKQTYELYATQQVSDKDIDEAHAFLKERRQELSDVESMIERVGAVKNKVKFESIPLVKEWRNKRREKAQYEIDKAVEEAREARALLARKVAKVGKAKKNFDTTVNDDYNNVIRELGQDIGGKGIPANVPTIFPGNVVVGTMVSEVPIERTFGISEKIQEDLVESGNVPDWAKETK